MGLRYEDLPHGKDFLSICEVIYGYQYTKMAVPFSEDLAMWLFEHSGGVPALIVSLLIDVQEAAIMNGTEMVNIAALEELYRKQYRMVRFGLTNK